MKVLLSIFFCLTLLSFSKYSIAIDTITQNQTLRDNGETLISIGKSFELGFFSPWNSNNRYIGIWFKNVPQQTVVWVANKDNPITDSSGILTITANGNIVVFNSQSGIPIWSSNSSATSNSPVLQLLDTGNLVVKDGSSSERYLFESFDHPCDTLLPGMKLGWNLGTNQNRFLTSWKSLQDPSTGDYTYKIDDPHGVLPQLILREGSEIVFRAGPWDGVRFGGQQELQETPVFKPIFVYNATFVYYSFENQDNTIISRFVVNQSGSIEHLSWNERSGEWILILTLRNDQYCSNYAMCGPYGICNVDTIPICRCPPGFMPIFPQDWNNLVWTGGCVRRIPKNCSAAEGFRKFSRVKLPDNSHILGNNSVRSPVECEEACLRNCSCVAYATTDVSVCVVWFGSLLDIAEFHESGQELYIRMAASELESHNNVRRTAVIITVSIISGVLLLVLILCYLTWKRGYNGRQDQRVDIANQDYHASVQEEDIELPLFDLNTIRTATNDFSFTNKIGEGGFGAVYKGTLPTGQEIGVKRLSRDSGQGINEFRNEVILIAKLQHRNLVRLLGCCIHGEERMLIYEYMTNRSLDFYIFNQKIGSSLVWQKRFDIIVGIARGLLYLHRDSRLRIIHRDLKASNILLDGEMNPKISDFGLARTFGGDQTEANTNRIMGTYGYMSPEYAIDGLFSVKSDIFSYGVLVLEIVSGKKNRGFYHANHDLNLLGHAWNLWNEGRPMELLDSLMENPVPTSDVLRCIQVGLLCVQQRPEDRPTMSSVLLMLDSENPLIPQPKQPGFYTQRFPTENDSSSTGKMPYTANEVTITILQGR